MTGDLVGQSKRISRAGRTGVKLRALAMPASQTQHAGPSARTLRVADLPCGGFSSKRHPFHAFDQFKRPCQRGRSGELPTCCRGSISCRDAANVLAGPLMPVIPCCGPQAWPLKWKAEGC